MKELISIVVPVYNVADFLAKTINSILAQTYKNFELILVNDGSPDNSGAICDEYATKDNRIRVFHNDNMGAGEARKFGANQAKGEWIMFVDGDDTIPSDSISNLFNLASKKCCDIAIGTLNLNNSSIFLHKRKGILSREEYIEALLLNETSIGPCGKLYRASLYKDYSLHTYRKLKNNEDLLMLIYLSTKIEKVYISNEIVTYNYLFREGSASKSIPMPLQEWENLFLIIKDILSSFMNIILIKNAFYTYQVRRLFDCNILHGRIIMPDSDMVKEIRDNIVPSALSSSDRKKYNIINSIARQRQSYFFHESMTFVKNLVKRIMRK